MISKIAIKNFRSIVDLEIDVENLVALIGPNSVGKTNILKAIDLVLGEGWTTQAKVARELFNDPSKEIYIEITLDTPIRINSTKYPLDVESVELTMSITPELIAKTTYNGGKPFYGQKEFKSKCHFIHIPSSRFLQSELRVSNWTMLGKMMRLVYENYVKFYSDDEETLKNEFEDAMEPAKNFLQNDFDTSLVTFHRFQKSFVKHCKRNSAGLAINFKPTLDIYDINWFYKTLQIHIEEDSNAIKFNSAEVGSGMQNLLLLSIFETYAELMGKNVIFGIEEPEIYLYPQAQRHLYKNLINLSEESQIFYTTHNPNFVSALRPDDIYLLRKDKEKGTKVLEKSDYFNSENADKHKYKIYTQFNTERNEMFFAKKVLFVEGDSEKILISTLCEEKWDIDLDSLGISIISCGGKNGVNYFVGTSELVGIYDYFAVWDEDPKSDSYKPDVDYLKKALKKDKGIEIKIDLETFLSISKSQNEKVMNAHSWAESIDLEDIPDEINKIKGFLLD